MSGLLAGLAGGQSHLKSGNARQLPPPVAKKGIKKGQLSFRSELAGRMNKKTDSIIRRRKSSHSTKDGGGLEGMAYLTQTADSGSTIAEDEEPDGPAPAVGRGAAGGGGGGPAPAPAPQADEPPPSFTPPVFDDGIPEWKKKVLLAKAQKAAKLNAPAAKKQQEDAERQAKLDAMPAWMRKLAENKK